MRKVNPLDADRTGRVSGKALAPSATLANRATVDVRSTGAKYRIGSVVDGRAAFDVQVLLDGHTRVRDHNKHTMQKRNVQVKKLTVWRKSPG
jgi:hypothetical protein